MDRLNYRYWEHEVWNDPKTPLVAKYTNIVDGCDPTVAIGDFEFCTGLKDKNGNLIYEGDRVGFYVYGQDEKWYGGEGTVVWYNSSWRIETSSHFIGFENNIPMANPQGIEIIGNIHEQKDI